MSTSPTHLLLLLLLLLPSLVPPLYLVDDRDWGLIIDVGGHWELKVTRIGEAVGANWSEVRQSKVATVDLQDVAAAWAIDLNLEANAALQSKQERGGGGLVTAVFTLTSGTMQASCGSPARQRSHEAQPRACQTRW